MVKFICDSIGCIRSMDAGGYVISTGYNGALLTVWKWPTGHRLVSSHTSLQFACGKRHLKKILNEAIDNE